MDTSQYHYFVFDGVFERCIEYHFHCFSLNEPHFNDATAESSVSEDFDDDNLNAQSIADGLKETDCTLKNYLK